MGCGPHHAQRGDIVVEWVVGVALLLFPVLGLLALPRWIEGQNLARLGAQEAARAVVVAADADTGESQGARLVAEIARNHGYDPSDVAVAYSGSTEPGGSVTATVTIRLPALALFGFGSVGSRTWTTAHTELVDAYASRRAP